ncbi:unnamed protein product [Choristocarpus tenellus]
MKSEDGRIAILSTYVDDTATTGDFTEEIQRIRASLLEKYEGRDLGTPDKPIGVGIAVGADGITLDQPTAILGKHRHDGDGLHRSAEHIYTARPTFVNWGAGWVASPFMRHWRGLQHVLRYEAGTLDVGIHYGRGFKVMDRGDGDLLVGYGDSDWGTDSQTCRSVTQVTYFFSTDRQSPVAPSFKVPSPSPAQMKS